jgi:hypothetical protein
MLLGAGRPGLLRVLRGRQGIEHSRGAVTLPRSKTVKINIDPDNLEPSSISHATLAGVPEGLILEEKIKALEFISFFQNTS